MSEPERRVASEYRVAGQDLNFSFYAGYYLQFFFTDHSESSRVNARAARGVGRALGAQLRCHGDQIRYANLARTPI